MAASSNNQDQENDKAILNQSQSICAPEDVKVDADHADPEALPVKEEAKEPVCASVKDIKSKLGIPEFVKESFSDAILPRKGTVKSLAEKQTREFTKPKFQDSSLPTNGIVSKALKSLTKSQVTPVKKQSVRSIISSFEEGKPLARQSSPSRQASIRARQLISGYEYPKSSAEKNLFSTPSLKEVTSAKQKISSFENIKPERKIAVPITPSRKVAVGAKKVTSNFEIQKAETALTAPMTPSRLAAVAAKRVSNCNLDLDSILEKQNAVKNLKNGIKLFKEDLETCDGLQLDAENNAKEDAEEIKTNEESELDDAPRRSPRLERKVQAPIVSSLKSRKLPASPLRKTMLFEPEEKSLDLMPEKGKSKLFISEEECEKAASNVCSM
jgi:hypothetical protein